MTKLDLMDEGSFWRNEMWMQTFRLRWECSYECAGLGAACL